MKSFLVTLSLLLFAASALAAGAAVSYAVQGETFEGYYLSPKAGAPLVLLVHDWDGLNAYEIKRAEMLGKMGYAVFALDLFGKGVRPTTQAEKEEATNALYHDRERMRARLQGGLAAAGKAGGNLKNAVAIGYCFGGAAVLELARAGADLKGFVTFHGGLATPAGQDYSKTRGKLLILHGTADRYVAMTDFADLAVGLELAGVSHEMTTYSGAPHAFTVFGSESYRQDADEKSWRRFGEYLHETLR